MKEPCSACLLIPCVHNGVLIIVRTSCDGKIALNSTSRVDECMTIVEDTIIKNLKDVNDLFSDPVVLSFTRSLGLPTCKVGRYIRRNERP